MVDCHNYTLTVGVPGRVGPRDPLASSMVVSDILFDQRSGESFLIFLVDYLVFGYLITKQSLSSDSSTTAAGMGTRTADETKGVTPINEHAYQISHW
jgi:hypothetical protein